MPIHLRELHKGQRFVLIRTGDKFVYLGVGVSPYSGSFDILAGMNADDSYGAKQGQIQPMASVQARCNTHCNLFLPFVEGVDLRFLLVRRRPTPFNEANPRIQ